MKKKTIMGVMMMSILMTACSTQEKEKTKEAVRVQTEKVSMADADMLSTTYVGDVEAESSTAVSFTGSGTVTKVLVNEGQYVNKGQLIAVMDDTQNQNAVMAAEAMMKQAQDAYDRMKVLYERKSLSEMDWVEVQSKLQQAKSSLLMAQKAKSNCRLLAPCSGVVGNKMIESGMTALPAQPVCNIMDIRRLKVKISVPEKEIMNIANDATITVDALGGEEFHSVGVEKNISADAISRTYDVRYVVNNADRKLLPGMVCEVKVDNGQQNISAEKLVTVPITSVQRSADGSMFVWTVKQGVAHRSKVDVGSSKGNRISVLSGINEGDIIVVKGYQKLNEGAEVINN